MVAAKKSSNKKSKSSKKTTKKTSQKINKTKKEKEASKKSKKGFFNQIKDTIGDELKDVYGKYKGKVLHLIYDMLEINLKEILQQLAYLGEFKLRLKRAFYLSMCLLLGLFMVLVGLAELLANLYPKLMGGISYIIIGLTILIITLLYKIASD